VKAGLGTRNVACRTTGVTSWHPSLREGLDETLTVMRLGLTGTLRRTFATTNPIENMNGWLQRVARNVKRWKDEAMIRAGAPSASPRRRRASDA
jgi:hypothetical protein